MNDIVATQIIYTFDLETRELVGAYERETDTLTILGDDRTTNAPPEPRAGFAIIRNASNDGWGYLVDYRTQKQYSTADGTESEIKYLGEIQEGFTLEAKPASYYVYDNDAKGWVVNDELLALFLEETKAQKVEALNAQKDELIAQASLVTISAGTFSVDVVAINKLSTRLTAKQSVSDKTIITTLINTSMKLVNLTKANVIEILNAQDDLETSIFEQFLNLATQVESATTLEEIAAIQFTKKGA